MSPRGAAEPVNGSNQNLDEMDSDEIMKSLRQTTAEIQSFMSNSRDDLDKINKVTSPRMDSDQVSADSGLTTSMPDIRVDSPEGKVMEFLEFGSPNGSVFSSSSPPPPVSDPPFSPVFCLPSSSSSSSSPLHDAQTSSLASELHVSNIPPKVALMKVDQCCWSTVNMWQFVKSKTCRRSRCGSVTTYKLT